MYEHKLSNFEKAFLSFVKEHKEDEKEDAILAGEIKALVAQGGVSEDRLQEVVAAIMEKVQAHCEKMSEDAYSAGKEAGLDAAYHSQH